MKKSKTKKTTWKLPPKAPPKIECTFHTPDMQPLPSPARKSREFRILVQCTDKGGNVVRQAIFTELGKARGYIQIREACDDLTAHPAIVEIDPEVVGQWKVQVSVSEPPK